MNAPVRQPRESESPRVQAARRRAVTGSSGNRRKQCRAVARASSAIQPSPVTSQGSVSGDGSRNASWTRARAVRHSSQPRWMYSSGEASPAYRQRSPSQRVRYRPLFSYA